MAKHATPNPEIWVRFLVLLLKDSSSKRSVKPLAIAFAGSNPVCLQTRRHIQVVKGGGPKKRILLSSSTRIGIGACLRGRWA